MGEHLQTGPHRTGIDAPLLGRPSGHCPALRLIGGRQDDAGRTGTRQSIHNREVEVVELRIHHHERGQARHGGAEQFGRIRAAAHHAQTGSVRIDRSQQVRVLPGDGQEDPMQSLGHLTQLPALPGTRTRAPSPPTAVRTSATESAGTRTSTSVVFCPMRLSPVCPTVETIRCSATTSA